MIVLYLIFFSGAEAAAGLDVILCACLAVTCYCANFFWAPLLCMSLCDHACLSHSDLEHLQARYLPAGQVLGKLATIVHCTMKCKLLGAVDQEIRIAAVTELST